MVAINTERNTLVDISTAAYVLIDRFDVCSVESKSVRASRERKHGFVKRRNIPFLVGPLFLVIESEETSSKRVSESLGKTINLTCRVGLIRYQGNRIRSHCGNEECCV